MIQEKQTDQDSQQFMVEFYEQYRFFLFYAARKFTTDQRECEEIVHDAMVKLLRRDATLRGLNQKSTIKYIFLTVRSVYLDMERSGAKKEIPFSNPALEYLHAKQEQATDERFDYETKWNTQILKDALPDKEWQLLEAKYIMGCTDDEIAKEMNYAPDSVRTLLRRARERAKNILRHKPEEGSEHCDR